MLQVNPQQLLQMIRGGANPQQLMMNVLQNQMQGSPMGNNILQLVREGRTDELEKIARNYVQSRGLDYDIEFESFKRMLGLK